MFPTSIHNLPAPGIPGDFAGNNPRATHLGFPGGLVAGASATIGHFAWIDPTTFLVTSTGTGAPDGFVHRDQQGLITSYLVDNTNIAAPGFGITIFTAGDFFVLNTGAAAVAKMAAFANLADGSVQFAAPGATVAGAVQTQFFAMMPAAAGDVAKISTWIG